MMTQDLMKWRKKKVFQYADVLLLWRIHLDAILFLSLSLSSLRDAF